MAAINTKVQIFTIWSNEIEGRLDTDFYKPEYVELEKKIRKITDKKLGDFILDISGGATPDTKQAAKYYTDSINGIKFIRVQNLSPEGLKLDDCKYINRETHGGMLKRSQVKDGDLLTKITGVGRMAVSSVVPKGMEANINQHIVAIKTKNPETSKILAAFLNSDIGEKLASRRSTGGTRPALDYEALKKIPVVFNPKIVEVMNSVYKKKIEKENQSKQILDSIDDYVLEELGIKMPEMKNETIFDVWSDEVEGKRLDAEYNQEKYKILQEAVEKGKYETAKIKDVLSILSELKNISNYEFINYIDLSSVDEDFGAIVKHKELESKEIPSRARQKINKNDLLLASLKGSLKSIAMYNGELNNAIASTGFFVIKNSEKYNNFYLWSLFRTNIYQMLLEKIATGAIMSAINKNELEDLSIPLPPVEAQNKIAAEVKKRISEAERLKKEADEIVEKAKKEVEEIILCSDK